MITFGFIAIYKKDCDIQIMKTFFEDIFQLLRLTFFFFVISLALSLLFIPTILVIITQIYCIYSIYLTLQYKYRDDDLLVRWLINVFFSFLICNEVVQAIKTFFHLIFRIKSIFLDQLPLTMMKIFRILGYFVALFSPLSQIYMAFAIYYISTGLIYTDMDIVDFVQNFAGFYIILEFDNYVMKFLQNIEFYSMLKSIVNFSKKKRNKPQQKLKRKSGNTQELYTKLSNVTHFSNYKFRSVLKKLIKDSVLKTILTEESFVGEEEDNFEKEKNKKLIILVKILTLASGFIICLTLFFSLLKNQ